MVQVLAEELVLVVVPVLVEVLVVELVPVEELVLVVAPVWVVVLALVPDYYLLYKQMFNYMNNEFGQNKAVLITVLTINRENVASYLQGRNL